MFFIVFGIKHHGELSAAVRALQQVVAFFTNTFVGPIYATGLTLFYYDQRVRKEGYDIEWMMQAAGMSQFPPPIVAEPQPSPVAGAELPPELPPPGCRKRENSRHLRARRSCRVAGRWFLRTSDSRPDSRQIAFCSSHPVF